MIELKFIVPFDTNRLFQGWSWPVLRKLNKKTGEKNYQNHNKPKLMQNTNCISIKLALNNAKYEDVPPYDMHTILQILNQIHKLQLLQKNSQIMFTLDFKDGVTHASADSCTRSHCGISKFFAITSEFTAA